MRAEVPGAAAAGLVSLTERVLTWRARRRLRSRARRRRKGALRDWAEAILSAVLIVLLVNQYLLQAYRIPSPSMAPTLLDGDRIFVNKLVYGPELVPGTATQYSVNPSSNVNRQKWRSYVTGIAVGKDELLPLGDNRDDWFDGRYFGPVKLNKVLGRAILRYWPPSRVGGIP